MWPFLPPHKKATNKETPSMTPAPRSAGPSEVFARRPWLETHSQRRPAHRDEPSAAIGQMWGLHITGRVCERPDRWLWPLMSHQSGSASVCPGSAPQQSTSDRGPPPQHKACCLLAGKQFPVHSFEGPWYPPFWKYLCMYFSFSRLNNLAEQWGKLAQGHTASGDVGTQMFWHVIHSVSSSLGRALVYVRAWDTLSSTAPSIS